MYFLLLKCALCEIAFDANKLKEYFDFSLCINNQPFSIKDALCTNYVLPFPSLPPCTQSSCIGNE